MTTNGDGAQPDGILCGKVALLAGTSFPALLEFARVFAAEGAALALCCSDQAGRPGGGMDRLAPELGVTADRVLVSHCAFDDLQALEGLVAAAVGRFGGIDISVALPAAGRNHRFAELAPEEWNRSLRGHLYAYFNIGRAVAPHFRRQGRGSYVHVVAAEALIGVRNAAGTAAATLATTALSKSIALDLAASGVRSNCIAVGGTALSARQAASVAAFIASDLARDVNGQIIGVNNGDIVLFDQPRPVRTLHQDGGWQAETMRRCMASWTGAFVGLETGAEALPGNDRDDAAAGLPDGGVAIGRAGEGRSVSTAPLLRGQVAIVTGAGRGIGRAIALQMAAAGARVVVNDLGVSVSGDDGREDAAGAVVREIRASGGEAIANRQSVAEWPSAAAMVEAALDAFGRLDIVVNNAGILRYGAFDEMTSADWDAVIKVHLDGSFYLSRAAAPHFERQRRGAFVHMTSASGLIGSTSQANYAAAKLGIVALSKSIALDMTGFGVRSNCIAPSTASRMTALVDSRRGGELTQEAMDRLQKSRAASQPEQVAPLAVFLASDAASAVNGQVIGARGNEIYLYSQHRPVRVLNSAVPWTPARLAQRLCAALKPSFIPLDRITDVFQWPAQ